MGHGLILTCIFSPDFQAEDEKAFMEEEEDADDDITEVDMPENPQPPSESQENSAEEADRASNSDNDDRPVSLGRGDLFVDVNDEFLLEV